MAFGAPLACETINFDSGVFNGQNYQAGSYKFAYTGVSSAWLVGNYYVTTPAQNVMHWHWGVLSGQGLATVTISRTDGQPFVLDAFILSSNTGIGGQPATGNENARIREVDTSSTFKLPSENWGLATLQNVDPGFNAGSASYVFEVVDVNTLYCAGIKSITLCPLSTPVPSQAPSVFPSSQPTVKVCANDANLACNYKLNGVNIEAAYTSVCIERNGYPTNVCVANKDIADLTAGDPLPCKSKSCKNSLDRIIQCGCCDVNGLPVPTKSGKGGSKGTAGKKGPGDCKLVTPYKDCGKEEGAKACGKGYVDPVKVNVCLTTMEKGGPKTKTTCEYAVFDTSKTLDAECGACPVI